MTSFRSADLETALAQPDPPYDLILAADTLVYLGDLSGGVSQYSGAAGAGWFFSSPPKPRPEAGLNWAPNGAGGTATAYLARHRARRPVFPWPGGGHATPGSQSAGRRLCRRADACKKPALFCLTARCISTTSGMGFMVALDNNAVFGSIRFQRLKLTLAPMVSAIALGAVVLVPGCDHRARFCRERFSVGKPAGLALHVFRVFCRLGCAGLLPAGQSVLSGYFLP